MLFSSVKTATVGTALSTVIIICLIVKGTVHETMCSYFTEYARYLFGIKKEENAIKILMIPPPYPVTHSIYA